MCSYPSLPPLAAPPPPPSPAPPIWAAGIGVVALLLVVMVIVVVVVALVCCKKLHKKKELQKVQPSGEGGGEGVQLLKMDLPPDNLSDTEDELNFTRTSSLTVIIPKGVCGEGLRGV